jgi:hypothetical protein
MILILFLIDSDRCNWQLWAVVLLMASFTWMGKQKKIISNNKDTAALRLSRKAVDFSWIRQIVTESVNHWVKIVPLCNITFTVIFWNYICAQIYFSHNSVYQYNIILLYYYIYCYFILCNMLLYTMQLLIWLNITPMALFFSKCHQKSWRN